MIVVNTRKTSISTSYPCPIPLLRRRLLLPLLLLLLLLALTFLPQLTHAKKSLPKSKPSIFFSTSHPTGGAWNPSPLIDSHGFLSRFYKLYPGSWERTARIGGRHGYNSSLTRQLQNVQVMIRQVPGDGNCLFHSLSTALCWVEEGVHLEYDQGWSRKGKRRTRTTTTNKWNGGEDGERQGDDTSRELDLEDRSRILRQIAVDVLRPKVDTGSSSTSTSSSSSSSSSSSRRHWNDWPLQFFKNQKGKKERLLFLQGSEYLRQSELLNVACSQYGITGEEYCASMNKEGVWGGGPEIVALCNYLKRPIHVYELMTWYPIMRKKRRRKWYHHVPATTSHVDQSSSSSSSSMQGQPSESENTCGEHGPVTADNKAEFRLRRMACFGSPKFDSREPICILSADCRFPDLTPGQQAAAGNHFMAILQPLESQREDSMVVGATKSNHWGGMGVRSGGVVSLGQGGVGVGGRKQRRKCGKSTFEKKEVIEKYVRSLLQDPRVGPSGNDASRHPMESILGKTLEPLKRILTQRLSSIWS